MAIDVEEFDTVIGEGAYTTARTARLTRCPNEVRIDPIPVPYVALVIQNVVFIGFFAGMFFIVYTFGGRTFLASIFCTFIGTLTCVVFTTFTIWLHRDALQRGPCLVFDPKTEKVRLPQEGVAFAREQVRCVQYITTRRPQRSESAGRGRRLTEVNIIVGGEGKLQRYPLLRNYSSNGYKSLVKQLAEQDLFPVVRVQESVFGDSRTRYQV